MELCPCGSNLAYDACCRPLIVGEQQAITAEQLMRSRYAAYAKHEIPYLRMSLHPDHRTDFDEQSTRAWAERAQWHKLDVIESNGGGEHDFEGQVEFIATYTDQGIRQEHHEIATFQKKEGRWYLLNGKTVPPKPVVRSEPKTGRNDPCPCGSGIKFKKCCGR